MAASYECDLRLAWQEFMRNLLFRRIRLSGMMAGKAFVLFAISTYNTDYILTKEENFKKAMKVLKNAGYEVRELS